MEQLTDITKIFTKIRLKLSRNELSTLKYLLEVYALVMLRNTDLQQMAKTLIAYQLHMKISRMLMQTIKAAYKVRLSVVEAALLVDMIIEFETVDEFGQYEENLMLNLTLQIHKQIV
ncbi:MAG: hypothetical protein GX138_08895 [Firmicutes bacterium]|jgi:hypothetical protein|nr:hypothetical protein [Bacillota bacterium]